MSPGSGHGEPTSGEELTRALRTIAMYAVAGALTACGDMQPEAGEPLEYEQLGVFGSSLSESSGIAVSRDQRGVFWTHNDSGDDALIFAVDEDGTVLGRFEVVGARAIDWEDIALGPCPAFVAARACLYLADTGDNLETRKHVDVYVVPEPPVSGTAPESRTKRAHRVRITYPLGPRNVEAVALDPESRLLLFSKDDRGRGVVLRVSVTSESEEIQEATVLDTLALAEGEAVTAAALSPDRKRVVVRTYTRLVFFSIDGNEMKRLAPTCVLGFRQAQGEAVDFLTDDWMLLSSEAALRRPGGLARTKCPPTQDVP